MTEAKKRKILIDWGSTNIRAFLVNSTGYVIEKRESDNGIKSVKDGDFLDIFQNLTQGWKDVNCTLMAGMIGSANGWEEVPYTTLPASVSDITKNVRVLSELNNAYIVGGLSLHNSDDTYDVIRGEETQVIGFLEKNKITAINNKERYTLCLLGTHSKWLEIIGDTITSFTTVMSGDFFSAICDKTIMSTMLKTNQQFSHEIFSRGVSLAQQGNIMSTMFKVRSSFLFNQIAPENIKSMISGIIIGSEIHEMKKQYNLPSTLHIIGSSVLIQQYAYAFEQFGMNYKLYHGEELSLAGMIRLAENI